MLKKQIEVQYMQMPRQIKGYKNESTKGHKQKTPKNQTKKQKTNKKTKTKRL